MNTIVIAMISITAIGLTCSVLLSVAGKLMAVKVDERVASLRSNMPGANCGACGFSGCDGYAAALVKEGAATNLCPPGGGELVKKINEILGTESDGSVVSRVAVVHCMGDSATMRDKMEYVGVQTCVGARVLFGGKGACTFGCNGFGDCVAVCPTEAICLENGLARIDPRKCNGCGLCVKACPSGVISVENGAIAVAVLCKNTEKGGALKDKCSKGCIGCMKCVKACPSQAITVADSLASIDYSKCDGCLKCVESCAKGCIVVRGA